MKQTTIRLELEEDIIGVNVLPCPARGSRYQYSPKPEEMKLWEELVTGASWAHGKHVEPKEGEGDTPDWWEAFGERLLRVCANRPKFKTKVRVVKTFPGGSPRMVAVTAYWNRPKTPLEFKSPNGTWTLKQHRNAKDGQGRIIAKITATLDCDGDDLYSHLPDGDVPEGYDTFPDVGDINVNPEDWHTDDARPWWSFRFRPTSNRSELKKILTSSALVHEMTRSC